MKNKLLRMRRTAVGFLLFALALTSASPALAGVGMTVSATPAASQGQNIYWGNMYGTMPSGGWGNFLKFTNGSNVFVIDANGNITQAGTITAGTYNGLTLTKQTLGFTIAGGTTPYTLTVTGNATISGNPLVSPMTTLGDVMYGAAGGAVTRLAGAAGFLKSTGAAAPAWSAVTASDVGLGNVENTKLSTWAGSANITTVGTITAGTWTGTAIGVAKGGTGTTNGTVASLSANGSNCGAGNYPLGVDASGNAESCTAVPATGMANPMTTAGDIIYGGAAGAATRLAGAAGILHSTGAAAPTWGKVSLTADVSGTLPAANGGTGNVNGTVASLTANGSNCAAGNYPLGVDASGNAESCTAAPAGVSGGTASYVARFTSATALSTGAIYDNGTYVGIGTTVPGTSKLNVQDSSQTDTAITAVSGTAIHATSNRNASGGIGILADCAGGDSSNCDYAITARGGWQAAVSGLTTDNNSSGAGVKGYSQYGHGVDGSGTIGVYGSGSSYDFYGGSSNPSYFGGSVSARGGAVTLGGSIGSGEGGEISLAQGSSGNTWTLDNYYGTFRMHHDGTVYVSVGGSGDISANSLTSKGVTVNNGGSVSVYSSDNNGLSLEDYSSTDGGTLAGVSRNSMKRFRGAYWNGGGPVMIDTEQNFPIYFAPNSGSASYPVAYFQKNSNGNKLQIGQPTWSTGNDSYINFGDGDKNYVWIGESGADDRLYIHANSGVYFDSDSVYKPSGGSFYSSSDSRLKKDVSSLSGTDALDKLSQLNGVNFRWINPDEHGGEAGVRSGIMAQNLKQVFPDWVKEITATGKDKDLVGQDGITYTTNYPSDFNAYLVEAIKELKAENDLLKAQNDEINNRLQALENKIK